jgi:hypothetical protein
MSDSKSMDDITTTLFTAGGEPAAYRQLCECAVTARDPRCNLSTALWLAISVYF